MSMFSIKNLSRSILSFILILGFNQVLWANSSGGIERREVNESGRSQSTILDHSNIIELKPGTQVFNRDLNLLLKINEIHDSRCPIDSYVACFWAGNVRVSISIISRSEFVRNPDAEWDVINLILGVNGEKADYELSSGYTIKVLQVLPLPEIDADVEEAPVVILSYEETTSATSSLTPGVIELQSEEQFSNPDLNLELKLNKIADSRCPIGALCIWQGYVQVSISIIDSSKLDNDPSAEWEVIDLVLGLENEKSQILLNSGHVLKLEDVLPYPNLNAQEIDAPVVVLSYSKPEVN